MDTVFLLKIIQTVTIAALFFLFVYTKMQKPSEMQKYASMLSIGTILMLSGNLLETNAQSLEGAYYGIIVYYLGEPFLLVSVFLLVCTFYGRKVPRWAFLLMMTVGAVISLLVATNPFHYLYYSYVGYDAEAKYTPLVLRHGPLYLLSIATLIFYNGGVAVMILTGFTRSKSALKRRLSVYTLLMIVSAVLGFVLYNLNVAEGYDTTMLGLVAGSIFLAILFFRCRIFDVVDMAKDYALDRSADGLMIFDDTGKLVYSNATASEVVGSSIPTEYVDSISDGKSVYRVAANVYSVNAGSIRHKNSYLGKSVEIHDITESYHYQEKLEEAVTATTTKLENIQRTILGSFASLVEARSLETGDHIRRVSEYTDMIARELKREGKFPELLTDSYIKMLVHSAPLHDVGKISISDTILLKPGKLTAEEFEEMKKHSELGAKVISSTMAGLESEEYVRMATDIALYHHERWDGTGYPRRLKGSEIPLSARIVAVADVYDALISERCYKKAMPEEKACGIIAEESGTHFDPEIGEAFLKAVQEEKKFYG